MKRIDTIREMLKSDESNSFLRFALAKEMEGEEMLEEAIDVLQKLRDDDPEYVGLYYHLGALIHARGENDAAMAVYQDGIRIAQDQGDLHSKSELLNALTNLQLGLD